MVTGMFDALTALQSGQRQEDLDRQALNRFMAQGRAPARAFAGYEAADLAGQGLRQTVAGLAGSDPRTQREREIEALTAAKAAMSELPETDLSKPENVDAYYRQLIGILRQHGLPGEAHAAAQEWNKERNALTDRRLKEDELNRKRAADTAKAETERAKVATAAERNRLLAQRGAGEFVGWIERIEKTDDPATKQLLLDRANAEIESKKKGIILEPAGDRVIVRDKATGAVIGTDVIGEAPEKPKDRQKREDLLRDTAAAYRADMLALQTNYKAAADLYNSAGLDNLIGRWSGIATQNDSKGSELLREFFTSTRSDEGLAALGLFEQVRGATFIKALKDLKASGRGSTGLGAVSEIEGNKIQAANNALYPRQQPASFRKKLADYINTIEESANQLAIKAQEDGLAPIQLAIVPLTGPVKGRAPAPASTKPRAAPAAPSAAANGDMVRVRRPDGVIGRIPRSKLDAYKARGYEEIK